MHVDAINFDTPRERDEKSRAHLLSRILENVQTRARIGFNSFRKRETTAALSPRFFPPRANFSDECTSLGG